MDAVTYIKSVLRSESTDLEAIEKRIKRTRTICLFHAAMGICAGCLMEMDGPDILEMAKSREDW